MAKKIKDSFFWIIICVIGLLIIGIGNISPSPGKIALKISEVKADTATTGVTVGNAAPTVGAVILNAGSAISLTASDTKAVYATTTISDTNGWEDIATVTAVFYNSSSTLAEGYKQECTADENSCYNYTAGSDYLGVTCDWIYATTATTYDASCTADIYFDAVPTDSGNWAVALGYEPTSWEVWFQATDAANATNSATTSQEVNTLSGLEVQEVGIDYGTVSANATSTTGKSITVNTVGNCPINTNIDGIDMATSALSIDIYYQKFGLTDVGWEDLTTNASSATQLLNLASGKTEASSTPESDLVYWGLYVPAAQSPGDYFGENTIAAVEDTIDW